MESRGQIKKREREIENAERASDEIQKKTRSTSKKLKKKKKKRFSFQDESNPDFVSEVATLYFSDSTEKLDKLSQALSQVQSPSDPSSWAPVVDAAVHQFKGASASFGAAAVAAACVRVRAAAQAGDFGAVRDLLQNEVRREFEALRARMGEYLELDQRRKALLRGGGGGGGGG